jgi:hypothetical protein
MSNASWIRSALERFEAPLTRYVESPGIWNAPAT